MREGIYDRYLKGIYWMWSGIYDRWIDRYFQFDRNGVIAQLDLQKCQNILEIGVGTGLNLPYYPDGITVTGIDISSSMLEKAKRKKHTANLKLLLANACLMPFANGSFDHALCTYVLRVSPNPINVLNEVSRVVKDGGKFVIVDQFKGKNTFLLLFLKPLKLILGWGKEYRIEELISGTDWEILIEKP